MTSLTLKCWEEDIVSGDQKRMRKKDEKPLPVGKKRKVQEISLTTENEEGEKKKSKKNLRQLELKLADWPTHVNEISLPPAPDDIGYCDASGFGAGGV